MAPIMSPGSLPFPRRREHPRALQELEVAAANWQGESQSWVKRQGLFSDLHLPCGSWSKIMIRLLSIG
jgi:hypothetical protein